MHNPLWPALGMLLAGLAMPGGAALHAGEEAIISLAELATKAGVIALAQVRDTDYLRRRDLPVSGSAYLKVLIPYKSDRPVDLIEVYEKGVHDTACYFPNPSVFEEGRRYLVFLQRDPDHPERFRGLAEGCAMDVLVEKDNRYAVRLPITGFDLSDRLSESGEPLQFSDPYAVVADTGLPPALRDRMRDSGQIIPYENNGGGNHLTTPRPALGPARQWLYTRGITLADFRELLELEPRDRRLP